jgi:hypothetical protein
MKWITIFSGKDSKLNKQKVSLLEKEKYFQKKRDFLNYVFLKNFGLLKGDFLIKVLS